MDNKTVFVVTLRGEGELRNHTRHLSEDFKRALLLVDDKSSVEELTRRAAPSLRANLVDMLRELADGWFIQDRTKMGHVPRMAVPKPLHKDDGVEELDFTDISRQPGANVQQTETGQKIEGKVSRDKTGSDTVRIWAGQDTIKTKAFSGEGSTANQQAEADRIKSGQDASEARAQLEAAQARMATEARARAEAEARERQQAEIARVRAEQEAADARAQLEAAQARIEAEAKARAQAESRVKLEAETARIKTERAAAEARTQLEAAQARIEVEARARTEVEARAKQKAEAALLKAEQEATEARAQLEAAQARIEIEARARAEAEAKAKQETEAAQVKAEQEAAEARAQLEAAQARMEVEASARAESEARARQEAEAARLKAEQVAADARSQLEAAQARIEVEAQARTEVESRAKQEAKAARVKAEQEAAEARAQLEAAQARIEIETRARAEAEARAKLDAEAARLKAEQEAMEARTQLEAAQARIEIETRARAESEARAKQEAEAARLRAEQVAAEARSQLEAAQARIEAESRARAEAETRAKQEAGAALLKAEKEAAEAREQLEAVQSRMVVEAQASAEAEARAKQEAEAARLKAEQEAAAARAQLEAAQLRIEVESRARAEAEARAKQEAEAARLKAEKEAARLRSEVEAILLEAEQKTAEARSRFEATTGKAATQTEPAGETVQDGIGKENAAHADATSHNEIANLTVQLLGAASRDTSKVSSRSSMINPGASSSRSMIATVLFLDIVSYTKWSVSKQIELKKWFNILVWGLISEIEESTRIILDTGDGAAIGFLQHPEQAIEVALQFRQALIDKRQEECPDLRVRMGINLGPVNILMDMNGQSNMLGDGINDAQRIMSFAKADHIYISRPYYDVISRLSGEYVKWLIYRGTEKDKHGRQYQVYEVTKGAAEPAGQKPASTSEAIKLGPFTLSGSNAALESGIPLQTSEALSREPEQKAADIELVKVDLPAGYAAEKSGAGEQMPVTNSTETKSTEENKPPAEEKSQEEEKPQEIIPVEDDAEPEEDKAKLEEDLRKMAEAQAKAWQVAEQRAKVQASAQNLAKAEQAASARQPETREKVQQASRAPRRSLPLMKILAGLLVLLLIAIFSLPYVWPMHGYTKRLETILSEQFNQPVHISVLKATLMPLPKLELNNVSMGNAGELKASRVVLNFSFSALFNEVKPIASVEADNLEFRADSFGKTLQWLQAVGGNRQYPVQRMEVENAHLSNPDLKLPSVSGDASFDEQGHFLKVVLNSADRNLGILLQPQEARDQIVLNLKDGSLPPFPEIRFDELNLKGNLGNSEIIFSEIAGRLYGGDFSGNARVNWHGRWQLLGHARVNKLRLREVVPNLGIEGEMQGDTDFNLASATLQRLGQNVSLDGNFRIRKGTFTRLDILEAARESSTGSVSGGRTSLDDVSGTIQGQNNSLSFHQLKFSSDVMDGSGAINVNADGHLSGQLSVELKVKPESVSLQVSGTPAEPVLAPAR